LEDFFAKRYGFLAVHRFPLQPINLTGSDSEKSFEDFQQKLAGLLDKLPRSQVYQIAQSACSAPTLAETELEEGKRQPVRPLTKFQESVKRFIQLKTLSDNQKELDELNDKLWNNILCPPSYTTQKSDSSPPFDNPSDTPLDRWQWLHLVELLDYLAPNSGKGDKS